MRIYKRGFWDIYHLEFGGNDYDLDWESLAIGLFKVISLIAAVIGWFSIGVLMVGVSWGLAHYTIMAFDARWQKHEEWIGLFYFWALFWLYIKLVIERLK